MILWFYIRMLCSVMPLLFTILPMSKWHFGNQNKRNCLCFQQGVLYLSYRRQGCNGNAALGGCPLAQAVPGGRSHWEPSAQPQCRHCGDRCFVTPLCQLLWAGVGGEEQIPIASFWVCKHWRPKDKETGKNGGRGLNDSHWHQHALLQVLPAASFVPVTSQVLLGHERREVWGSSSQVTKQQHLQLTCWCFLSPCK